MAKVCLVGDRTDGYRLEVDGAPFYVKGAGLEFGQLASLAGAGGNTFRTWRVANGERSAEDILDEAQSLGLMVCMGLDMARERHGFDYSDAQAVALQNERMMLDVNRLKDHPALLMWGLGNELNLRATNAAVWDAVEDLATRIKAADSNHPVTTMLAGIDEATVSAIAAKAPSLDFLSFQIYGEIDQLGQLLSRAGYDGPYQLTEWGPTGHWESPKTAWGRPIEPNSSQKARDISRRYDTIILADSRRCLGAYIFLWGQKQERTPTWYSMFLEDGKHTEAVEVMNQAWTGQSPKRHSLQIKSLTLSGQPASASVTGQIDDRLHAQLALLETKGNPTISWTVCTEVSKALESDGGDFEPTPPSVLSSIGTQNTDFAFQLSQPGEYRLFCQVDMPDATSAVVNLPFLVKPKSRTRNGFLNFFRRKM